MILILTEHLKLKNKPDTVQNNFKYLNILIYFYLKAIIQYYFILFLLPQHLQYYLEWK